IDGRTVAQVSDAIMQLSHRRLSVLWNCRKIVLDFGTSLFLLFFTVLFWLLWLPVRGILSFYSLFPRAPLFNMAPRYGEASLFFSFSPSASLFHSSQIRGILPFLLFFPERQPFQSTKVRGKATIFSFFHV
ncbi:MAG: hypothetical protein IJ773_02735, partial [Lachnospiraceae bacterium]|nr:hypothetical protein [Lachnospiraceae bacterium]